MVTADFFEHVLQLPLSFHTAAHSGRQVKVMFSGRYTMWCLWLSFFREYFAAFVFVCVLLPTTLALNWRLAMPLLVLCAAFAALTALVVHKAFGLQRTVEQHYSAIAETAADTLGNVALVQSYARVDREVSGLRDLVNALLNAQLPVPSWWAAAAVLTHAGTTLTMLTILVFGTYLKLVGLASIGQIVSFMSIAGLLIARLEQSVSFANRMFLDAPKLIEFFDVLDTEPALRDRPDAIDPGRLRGRVEFNNVSLSYDGRQPAVSNLSFTAQPGDTVALVGPTGSGKSTALALLHRAFDPQSGSIAVDGIDIRDFQLTALRHNIGVVFQETLLFNRSIAETCASAGRMPAIATCARRRGGRRRSTSSSASRTASKLPSANAAGFSPAASASGWRSRARALLKDPPILILDEPTSALDPVTVTKVTLALDEVMKGRTTFVIAHRLATIRNVTRILVFRNGRIVETGTFGELHRRGGFFAEFVEAEFVPLPLHASEEKETLP
jgi:ATP-binding cassette subfamily B protein